MSLAVEKKRKMNEKKLSILDLNNDCMLEIMKCIIAGCELRERESPDKYVDMENFAMTDDSIKELLRTYYKEVYYHRELTVVAKVLSLTIDFAQLQTTIANKNEGDAYWKLYAKALRRNNIIKIARLSLDPASLYPEFPKHFQMVKGALENKKSLIDLGLTLNGYSLDNLNYFKHLSKLKLDVRISAESLVSICQSVPHLSVLEIMSTEIQGRLSDIVPHCRHLELLTFVPKPNVDGSEYAPLVQLPHLSEITIHGAYKNGSLLPMFLAMKDWQRAQTSPLAVNFTDVLPLSSSVTMARISLMSFLSSSLEHRSDKVELKTSYDFLEISRDSRPIEESLASMIVTAASFEIDSLWKGLTLHGCSISAISNLISVLKLFNINNLTVAFLDDYEVEEIVLPKLFESLIPDGLFALKSILINEADEFSSRMPLIDQLATRELLRIKSLTFLKCSFSHWESIELLCELTNLQTLDIGIWEREFEKAYAKALCNLLDTCQVSTVIRCCDWIIVFKKNERIPGLSSDINTLKVFDPHENRSLNELFEALANRMFKANEELDISNSYLDFKDIAKVSEIKTLKKLRVRLSDTNGIEKLSELTELEELSINHVTYGSLANLFEQMATKEFPTLQCLNLCLIKLSPEEVLMISRLRSLKKLELFISDAENCASVTKLADTNIEELMFTVPHFSLQKLLNAFAKKKTNRLRQLKNFGSCLKLTELTELSKLKTLKCVHTLVLDSKTLSALRKLKYLENLDIDILEENLKLDLPTLKTLVIQSPIGVLKCKCLGELENVESLTLSLEDSYGIHYLCNIKGLKKLIIEKISHYSDESGYYKRLACKVGVKLEHLSLPIRCLEDLRGITKIKSLKNLKLRFTSEIVSAQSQPIKLGQLKKLKSLYIHKGEDEFKYWLEIFGICSNLTTCTIEQTFIREDNFVRKIHTLMKTIRDPVIQDPLLLTVILNIYLDFDDYHLLEYPDDAYLKVHYSFNICEHAI